MDPTTTQAREKMLKAFEVLRHDFSTVHVGKANPALVENILVTAYGESQKFKLMELSSIHVQDPKTIVITPFDQSIMSDIQKGIQEANLGFNPVVNANIIRINIPSLTEERRKELVKVVNQKGESGKVMIRQIRHEAMEDLKKQGGSNTISEDDVTRLEKEVQKITDEFIEKIDQLLTEKKEELMRI